MKKINKKYLIIGEDGFLGSSIKKSLLKSGEKIYSTSCLNEYLSDTCYYLDLSKDIADWKFPHDIDVVFFCSAITSIKECEKNRETTRKINVENTIKISRYFLDNGAFIIFPSTNLVFDGNKSYYKVDDETSPIVEYANQKLKVEKELLSYSYDNCAIVRFTKILGNKTPLFINWINLLKNNEIINPFSDLKIAPISIDFAAKVMIKIAKYHKSGIWHVSGNKDITYEEIARYFAEELGVNQELIQPIMAKNSNIYCGHIASHTTLDITKIQKELELQTDDVWEIISDHLGK